jgi:hypothetical protein
MITDPGYVPVPEVKIDFSDTGSRKIRDDDWTVCPVDNRQRFHRFSKNFLAMRNVETTSSISLQSLQTLRSQNGPSLPMG